ncbi:MAG: protein translocase subunit SecD [Bacteriovoracaceae bacterium]
MRRGWWYRFIFLFIVTTLSVMAVMPTALDLSPEDNFPVKSKVNLGLDLQGGLYMILGIDFNKAYKDEINSVIRRMNNYLEEEELTSSIGTVEIIDVTDPMQWLEIDAAKTEEIKNKLRESGLTTLVRLTAEEEGKLKYGLTKARRTEIKEQAVTKSIEVIRNRIDEFGVTEPEITSQGEDRIVVQLPGVRDIERAKALIGKTAKLEFKMVNNEIPTSQIVEWVQKAEEAGIKFERGGRFSEYLDQLNIHLKSELPKGYVIAFEKKVSKNTNEVTEQIPYLVDETPRITGDLLQEARVAIDQQKNEPYVSLEFKSAGATLFEKVTDENVGRNMAIILDGNVYSAPNIRERISGGRASITLGSGGYNRVLREARDLALVLRAGALPVQLDFEEQRTVGPSLGQDAIAKARYGGLLGIVAVFLFIFFYYRVSGAIATTTLCLNVIFVLAVLVGFEATLTLPGIAGIALTVGMAVDANIIIYERIREEVRKGVSYYKAVESGFAHAFWTIIDANITTALAGIALINFGTGPIRGFAVTLLIGIVSTIYTSYFVSKLFFEFYLNKVEGQKLSI